MQTIDEGISHVDIGPPQEDQVKGGSFNNTVTIDINDDFFWSQWMQGVAFGNTGDSNSYTFDGGFPYTITDTGSSHLFLPIEYLEALIVKIVEEAGNPDWEIHQGIPLVECNANFRPIYFMMQNHWIKINPEEYIFDISEN